MPRNEIIIKVEKFARCLFYSLSIPWLFLCGDMPRFTSKYFHEKKWVCYTIVTQQKSFMSILVTIVFFFSKNRSWLTLKDAIYPHLRQIKNVYLLWRASINKGKRNLLTQIMKKHWTHEPEKEGNYKGLNCEQECIPNEAVRDNGNQFALKPDSSIWILPWVLLAVLARAS